MTDADTAQAPVQNTAPDPQPRRRALAWFDGPMGKLGLITCLVLLMQVPLSMVSGLIAERQERQEAVNTEMARNWGPAQTVEAPILLVPVVRTSLNPAVGMPATRAGWLRIPASQLDVAAQIQTESRRRGLFQATVFTTSIDLAGAFKLPELPGTPEYSFDAAWTKAVLLLGATDLRGQAAETPAEVSGQAQVQTLQETGAGCGAAVTVPAGLSGVPEPGAAIPFGMHLSLRGTRGLTVVPGARQVSVRMTSASASPGFTGPNPPLHSSVGSDGFQADWQVVGTSPVTAWQMEGDTSTVCQRGKAEGVGVELLQPVPTYLMVTRAAKYGTLFLVLAFATYFLFERLASVSIHVVQYALLGLSVSLFALLLVAVAEPLGFGAGYAVATAAVMGQASLYTVSVVGSRRLAATFTAVLGSLFAFLYVVISLETYALLVGSTGVFVTLSVLMAVTRRLDWGGTGRRTVA